MEVLCGFFQKRKWSGNGRNWILLSDIMKVSGSMMNRKIVVCDDEKNIIRQIDDYLKQFAKETGISFSVLFYDSAEDLIAHMPKDADILLLDIMMKDATGLDAARKLRNEGYSGCIIFITSMKEYALEAFDVHAFSYLLKPLLYSDLSRSLKEAFRQLDKKEEAFLFINDRNETHKVVLNDVIYAEVYQHTSIITF